MSTSSQLSITLKRSQIGHPNKMRLVLRGLGLRKIGQTVSRPNTAQVRGLVNKVRHLIEVSGL
ncbi:MAG: 50S ribosomal protein L30 [Nitrospirota bacterium]|nr:50S ribosomal protein L30 [Nitrospirota bacterium]MDX2419759.1 50S ribosomal protein L30 [Nitrospirota bacterium]